MTQTERRVFLIRKLLEEQTDYKNLTVPQNLAEQKKMLRSLMNIRFPKRIGEDFLVVQDEYLQEEIAGKGITDLQDLSPVSEGIYLWQGDITTLRCDAIVNAANSGMTGCYAPCHGCIDNCIHTYAGMQLRLECAEIMKKQGHKEETGKAKITSAYNLPCKYVLHTVGPIISASNVPNTGARARTWRMPREVLSAGGACSARTEAERRANTPPLAAGYLTSGSLTQTDKDLLASCYRSCLELAEQNGVKSIAFCCISTGEFHFPNAIAAQIAVKTVKDYREQTKSIMEVIFNVFKDIDYEIYRELLGTD